MSDIGDGMRLAAAIIFWSAVTGAAVLGAVVVWLLLRI